MTREESEKFGIAIEQINTKIRNMQEEQYENGLLDGVKVGMARAWNVADAIVHLKWDGAYVKPDTVEQWFEMYTPEEAYNAITICQCKMLNNKKPYWIVNYEKNKFTCSACNSESDKATLFCPWCGKEMEWRDDNNGVRVDSR